MKKSTVAVLASAVSVASAVALASYAAYHRAFYCKKDGYKSPEIMKGEQYDAARPTMHALIAELEPIPYEEVYISSSDGLRLFGRYYHVRDGAPLQMEFHGYHGNAIRDFCGGNKLAREAGHNTLIVDQRAHGKSEGRYTSLGIKERDDCLRWIEWATARFGAQTPIILSGVSMGAATVLSVADADLSSNVRAIVADCPFSSAKEIIKKVCADMNLPPRLAMPFVELGSRLWGSFSLSDNSPVDSVSRARLPILIIHGEDDRFVPCEMSERIARGSDKCELHLFPGAGHGLSFIVDGERYKNIVTEFIERALDGYEK